MKALRLTIVNDNSPVFDTVTVVPTISAHIRELNNTIRESDRKEIESFGFSCAKGLWLSYKKGLMNKTALIDGKVAAIWGCGGVYMGSIGTPWLLTSKEVKKISPLKFARIYQREVYEMLRLFPTLVNYVDSDYHEAIRLLEIIGFTVGEPEQQGNGMFRRFSITREAV